MPNKNDIIYDGGELDEVVVFGTDKRKKQYLACPGRVYYNNAALFQQALSYMRKTGDKKGEMAIFMKRFDYERHQSSKNVLLAMGGVVAAGFVAGYAVPMLITNSAALSIATRVGQISQSAWRFTYSTARVAAPRIGQYFRPAWEFNKGMTYWKMGTNAVAQACTDDEGIRGIDIVSVLAEGVGAGFSTLTNGVECKPFSKEIEFRLVGYNKPISEMMFDMGFQRSLGYIQGRWTDNLRGSFKKLPSTSRLIDRLFIPAGEMLFQVGGQSMSKDIKKTYFENPISSKNEINR